MSDRTARAAAATAVVATVVATALAGLAAADTSPVALSITPAKVSFGKVPTGNTQYRSVTFTNTGAAAIRINGAWSAVDRLDPGFVWPTGDACLQVEWELLEPEAQCTITFALTPERTGSAKATFLLMVDDPGTTFDIRLSGVGTPH